MFSAWFICLVLIPVNWLMMLPSQVTYLSDRNIFRGTGMAHQRDTIYITNLKIRNVRSPEYHRQGWWWIPIPHHIHSMNTWKLEICSWSQMQCDGQVISASQCTYITPLISELHWFAIWVHIKAAGYHCYSQHGSNVFAGPPLSKCFYLHTRFSRAHFGPHLLNSVI